MFFRKQKALLKEQGFCVVVGKERFIGLAFQRGGLPHPTVVLFR
ncbi:hypothetical protein JCM19232_5485 [Vibrio ishigakensis]|uniref:Uncharacterized protein n=1 Tax=Vibrio ishigakensis TaxID=1481914 RepID=A0A0B8PTP0_9VIBR|nr:hypothetical protein JCM19232_5485 [Vibrio ishigakensis]